MARLRDDLRVSFVRRLNRTMIGFDLALGTATLLAPRATLRLLGHDEPSPDAIEAFRRNAPIWLTFTAGHTVAELRGEQRDWWALAWLRATELGTDVLWSRSAPFNRPGARAGLRAAGVGNAVMALAFARESRRRP